MIPKTDPASEGFMSKYMTPNPNNKAGAMGIRRQTVLKVEGPTNDKMTQSMPKLTDFSDYEQEKSKVRTFHGLGPVKNADYPDYDLLFFKRNC